MANYEITLELLSDACFGAGVSQNGLVNNEVLLDSDGYPYLLGKTFKGVLRESIDNIMYLALSENEDEKIDRWFGKKNAGETHIGGISKKTNDNQGELYISNFELTYDIKIPLENIIDRYTNLIKLDKSIPKNKRKPYIKLYRENVALCSIMGLESSTRISDKGTAKDGSLRTMRVLKKGIKFKAQLNVKEELSKDDEELLKQCLNSITSIGINKTRGKGRVKVSLEKSTKVSLTEFTATKQENEADNNVLLYKFKLLQPVKIVSSGSSYDAEDTQKHINGSAIRGAVLNRFIKGLNEESILEILEKIKFYNAYPLIDNNYSIPTPNIFRISKQDDKVNKINEYTKFTGTEDNDNFMFTTVFEKNDYIFEKKSRNKKYNSGEFCYQYKEDTLIAFDVKTKEYFHHTHGNDRENLFRYKAISENQEYYGIIDMSEFEGNNNSTKKVKEGIEKLDYLWLGGSKNSGYGKIIFERKKYFKNLEEAYLYMGLSQDEKAHYCYSDLQIKDDNEISDEMGMFNFENSSIDTGISSGYNSYWGSRTPSKIIIKKGSVISNEDFERLKLGDKLENFQEGYGLLLKNSFENINKIVKYNPDDLEDTQFKINNMSIETDISKRIKVDCSKNAIEYVVQSGIAESIQNKNMEKFEKYIERTLGKTYKSSINELINIIDESILKNDNGKLIEEWIGKKDSISLNRSQSIKNRKLINLEIIKSHTIQDIFKNNILEQKQENNNSFYGLNMDYENMKKNIESLVDIFSYKEKKYLNQILVRDILYYAAKLKN